MNKFLAYSIRLFLITLILNNIITAFSQNLLIPGHSGYLYSPERSTFVDNNNPGFLDSLFNLKGEIYFKFKLNDRNEINLLTEFLSVDGIKNNTVYAFANKNGFRKFLATDHRYIIIYPPDKPAKSVNNSSYFKNNAVNWNSYPTYPGYINLMEKYAKAYPSLCKLDTIGILPSGKMILVMEITGNLNVNSNKPRFLYSSTMHGNEPPGFVFMLHLIDSLLTGYGRSGRITGLVDNIDIYISPLANPDGEYRASDSTVYGGTRYNINNVDLNRNYPDPVAGPHPDGDTVYEPETKAFMAFATLKHFNMAANFHTGYALVNYPWDTWEKLTADNNWWVCVSTEFADTIQKCSKYNGYFTDEDNGITDGYAWYRITGGRQDYMNYFQHCRECLVELSDVFIIPEDSLSAYWGYTRNSLLNYLEKSLQGVRGMVTDSSTNKPLKAKVYIQTHDFDNSFVYSDSLQGDFHRYLYGGVYDISFSVPGYFTKTVNNVHVSGDCDSTTVLNVSLAQNLLALSQINNKSNEYAVISPNPGNGLFHLRLYNVSTGSTIVKIYDMLGKEVSSFKFLNSPFNDFSLNLSGLKDGLYLAKIFTNNKIIPVKIIINY